MTIKETAAALNAMKEVANAFELAPDIGVEIHAEVDSYPYMRVNLDSYPGRSRIQRDQNKIFTLEEMTDAIRETMRRVMAILGQPRITRGEDCFRMEYKGLKVRIVGYPSKYRVACEKKCYIVGNGKRIPIVADEPIDLETEQAVQAGGEHGE